MRKMKRALQICRTLTKFIPWHKLTIQRLYSIYDAGFMQFDKYNFEPDTSTKIWKKNYAYWSFIVIRYPYCHSRICYSKGIFVEYILDRNKVEIKSENFRYLNRT